MHSFHIVQGICKRSGWVSKVLMVDSTGNVSGWAQKKMGREVALHCLTAIYGFPLYFFITHTQTVCNRLVPCVGIMFTSYPRSFLPFPTAPPHNKKGDDCCAELHKSQEKLHDGGQVEIGRIDLGQLVNMIPTHGARWLQTVQVCVMNINCRKRHTTKIVEQVPGSNLGFI